MDPIKPPEGLPAFEALMDQYDATVTRDPLAAVSGTAIPVRLTKSVARDAILANPERRTIRKHARALAIPAGRAFIVETEHGPIAGAVGDWLVMNHPDDDPGGDAWPVSAERMAETYTDEEDITIDAAGIVEWLMDPEFDRLYWAVARANGHPGGSNQADEQFARRLCDELAPPPEPTDVVYLTLERAVDAGFNVHLIAGSARGSSYRFVELDRNGLLVAGQGSTLSEAVAKARTKFEADYPEPRDG